MITEDDLDEYAYRLGLRLRDLVDNDELRARIKVAKEGRPDDRTRYRLQARKYRHAREVRARNGERP